jgi:uroporphyrinogen III methyltransferase/synthase
VTVYLVGAGPGDPGLLTVRAAELLASAEVVVHDRLTPAELRDLAPATAELVDVGKHPGGPADAQTRINELLVELGRTGRRVVRLKGGDPFVFARGAEEAMALAEAGIDFEVVPGVTSAVAAPSSAGIPVTLRGHSAWVTVVTGHEDPAKGEPEVDWEAMGALGGTLVVLMGVKRWPEISARLVAGGRDPQTPAAAVRWGSRPEQQTLRGTLGSLDLSDVRPPATVVVGEVAAVDLNWFESRPLFGRTVVVTRTAEQAGELSGRLRRLGAQVLEVPTIAVTEPADGGAALRDAVARVADYEWVVLTSPNGARRFCAELRDGRDLAGVRLAAIGPGTADVLAEHHLVCDLVPERFVAEGLLEVFPAPSGRNTVLLARAEVARDVLPEGLAAAGWDVDVVTAYRTQPAQVTPETAEQVAAADAITFTSSSTVTNFVATGAPVPPVVAAIGPVTAATAQEAGLTVTVEAGVHTLDGLVDALVRHFAR